MSSLHTVQRDIGKVWHFPNVCARILYDVEIFDEVTIFDDNFDLVDVNDAHRGLRLTT